MALIARSNRLNPRPSYCQSETLMSQTRRRRVFLQSNQRVHWDTEASQSVELRLYQVFSQYIGKKRLNAEKLRCSWSLDAKFTKAMEAVGQLFDWVKTNFSNLPVSAVVAATEPPCRNGQTVTGSLDRSEAGCWVGSRATINSVEARQQVVWNGIAAENVTKQNRVLREAHGQADEGSVESWALKSGFSLVSPLDGPTKSWIAKSWYDFGQVPSCHWQLRTFRRSVLAHTGHQNCALVL